MRHSLFLALVVTALICLFGISTFAQETPSREYREALLSMQVRGGMMNEAQKKTILSNWDSLEMKGKKAEFILSNFSHVLNDKGLVESASVNFKKRFSDGQVFGCTVSLDNNGEVVTITIKGKFTPAQIKEAVEWFSKSCVVDEKDAGSIVTKWETTEAGGFSFIAKKPCEKK